MGREFRPGSPAGDAAASALPAEGLVRPIRLAFVPLRVSVSLAQRVVNSGVAVAYGSPAVMAPSKALAMGFSEVVSTVVTRAWSP
jgi:hypothetical protein